MEDKKKAVKKSTVKRKKRSKANRVMRAILITLCVIAVVCLIVAGAAYFLIQHYIGKMDYQADEDQTTLAREVASSILAEIDKQEGQSQQYFTQVEVTDAAGVVIGTEQVEIDLSKLTPDIIESIEEQAKVVESSVMQQQSSVQQATPIASSSDVYNILLIGVDNRAGSNWNGNSDTMILLTINSAKQRVYMTSFMRDTYVNIPGVGARKLNAAHAVGGGPLLCQTIEQNFRVNVNAYARVNFYSMIEIIDAIGGVDLSISADEARVANNYINEMCRGVGLDPKDYYVSEGAIHLNGMQAVAYMRIRYVGSDYARTQRQRTVLTLMFQKLKGMDIGSINNFLNTALPLVTHNIPGDKMTSLILNVLTYLSYPLEQYRVPFDGHFVSQNYNLLPDFNYTVNLLQQILY